MDFEERAKGCLLGLAIGDAMGAAVEFYERDTIELKPIKTEVYSTLRQDNIQTILQWRYASQNL